MTDITEVQRFTDAMISMIREDQGSGQIPPDVLSVDELDNYVDVDDYYRRIGLAAGDHDGTELRCAVDDEIGRRLASTQGGPWQVMWRPREGAPQNIGRTVGYATQAEAQAIGREHVRTHGGGFHLRREQLQQVAARGAERLPSLPRCSASTRTRPAEDEGLAR